MSRPLVSVLMIFLDEERFMAEAIGSVFAQTYPHWELILVDDGSSDRSSRLATRIAQEHPDRVRAFEHPGHANRGMSASRNLGFSKARGDYIAFLDADDVYLPRKLERQVEVLEDRSDLGMVYGKTQYWHTWEDPASGRAGSGRAASGRADWTWDRFGVPADESVEPPELLITFLGDGSTLPCMGSLMLRREVLSRVGGFEERFRSLYEDQALLAKVTLGTPAMPLSACFDRYRQHSSSACASASEAETWKARAEFLRWLQDYLHSCERADARVDEALEAALAEHGRTASGNASSVEGPEERGRMRGTAAGGLRGLLRGVADRLRPRTSRGIPRPGRVRFGDLHRVTPLSRAWGRERGRSLDRYYIESFLEEHRADIRGHVLEVGDATYTRRFGGSGVTKSDVLHVEEGNPEATVVADLSRAEHLPDSTFDCVILTQTLQLILDVPAALRTLHRILTPGGVLLATFPGITHTGDANWQEAWCWSFTTGSARCLFHESFGSENVAISSYGNVLAATAFLYGLAEHELSREELDHHDPAYDVIIAVRATRASV